MMLKKEAAVARDEGRRAGRRRRRATGRRSRRGEEGGGRPLGLECSGKMGGRGEMGLKNYDIRGPLKLEINVIARLLGD